MGAKRLPAWHGWSLTQETLENVIAYLGLAKIHYVFPLNVRGVNRWLIAMAAKHSLCPDHEGSSMYGP